MPQEFKFLDPGKLVDEDLELILVEKSPANEEKQYVPSYQFKMKNVQTGELMGYLRLSIGFNENIKYGGHIGYGVDEKFRGHNYAERSVRMLLSFAKMQGVNPLWITCNPENIASRKTCELAGGKLEEIVDLPEHNEQYAKGERKKCRYRFDL